LPTSTRPFHGAVSQRLGGVEVRPLLKVSPCPQIPKPDGHIAIRIDVEQIESAVPSARQCSSSRAMMALRATSRQRGNQPGACFCERAGAFGPLRRTLPFVEIETVVDDAHSGVPDAPVEKAHPPLGRVWSDNFDLGEVRLGHPHFNPSYKFEPPDTLSPLCTRTRTKPA
jgi:hypothetical protein